MSATFQGTFYIFYFFGRLTHKQERNLYNLPSPSEDLDLGREACPPRAPTQSTAYLTQAYPPWLLHSQDACSPRASSCSAAYLTTLARSYKILSRQGRLVFEVALLLRRLVVKVLPRPGGLLPNSATYLSQALMSLALFYLTLVCRGHQFFEVTPQPGRPQAFPVAKKRSELWPL